MSEAAIDAEGTSVSTESETAATESTDQPKEAVTETESVTKAEDGQPSGDETPTEDQEKQQKRSRVQERISTLTNRAKDAEAQAKELEDRAKAAEEKLAELQTGDDPVPTLEQFDYDQNAYQAAIMEWQSRQSARQVNQQMTEQQRWQAEQARQQAQREAMNAYQERQQAFELDHPDFRQVVSQYQIQTQHVAEAIVNSEDGPALAYHLAKNPSIASSIESTNPIAGLMELGRIAAQLSAPPPVTTSTAPKPAETVKPTGVTQKDPDSMTPDEYRAWRTKQRRGDS